MDKNKDILQTTLLIIIVTITGFLGMGMPLVALAYPILLTFIGLKNGGHKHLITFFTSLALLGVIGQGLDVLVIPFQYGILSIFTVYMVNKKYRVDKIILYSGALVFAMVLIHMGLKWSLTDVNVFTELEASLTAISQEQIEMLDTEGMKESEKSQMVNLLKSTVDYIVTVLPVLLIISSAFIGYINYYISSRLAKRSGRTDIEIPKFSKFIFPKHVIMGLGTILLISYGLKYVGNFNSAGLVENIMILIYVVFLLEGLSFTVYLINKMKIGKFFKVLFITIIALSSFLNIVLFSIGIVDIILDFRKLRKVSET